MPKFKNYLIRTSNGFLLARGEELKDYSSIAIVTQCMEPIPASKFLIIDISSGLFIKRDSSKKRLIEWWNKHQNEMIEKIYKVRNEKIYLKRADELRNEKHIWRQAGYEF